MTEKVLVAMSGGVDSACAAILLREQGYDVTGVTLRMYDGFTPGGTKGAADLAAKLDIPHYVWEVQGLFRERVINDFISEYVAGRTPNPCVVCNREIKFGYLIKQARALGFNYLATGHYCRRVEKKGDFTLRRPADRAKD